MSSSESLGPGGGQVDLEVEVDLERLVLGPLGGGCRPARAPAAAQLDAVGGRRSPVRVGPQRVGGGDELTAVRAELPAGQPLGDRDGLGP